MQPASALSGMRFFKPGVQRINVAMVGTVLAVKDGENACATLARLGLDVATP
jgi:hypothetical protein